MNFGLLSWYSLVLRARVLTMESSLAIKFKIFISANFDHMYCYCIRSSDVKTHIPKPKSQTKVPRPFPPEKKKFQKFRPKLGASWRLRPWNRFIWTLSKPGAKTTKRILLCLRCSCSSRHHNARLELLQQPAPARSLQRRCTPLARARAPFASRIFGNFLFFWKIPRSSFWLASPSLHENASSPRCLHSSASKYSRAGSLPPHFETPSTKSLCLDVKN